MVCSVFEETFKRGVQKMNVAFVGSGGAGTILFSNLTLWFKDDLAIIVPGTRDQNRTRKIPGS